MLTKFVNERATEATDAAAEDRERTIKATRYRAIVYLLAYSGVHGAQVIRQRNGSPRTVLRRSHVSLGSMVTAYGDVWVKDAALGGAAFALGVPCADAGPFHRREEHGTSQRYTSNTNPPPSPSRRAVSPSSLIATDKPTWSSPTPASRVVASDHPSLLRSNTWAAPVRSSVAPFAWFVAP